MSDRATALALAVEWVANPRARLDATVSGDRIMDSDEVLKVADTFLEWLAAGE